MTYQDNFTLPTELFDQVAEQEERHRMEFDV
jgi:rubrerythrin